MNENLPKKNKDVSSLSMQELNDIFYTKDGLRNFFAARGYQVNAEFVQRGDPADAEDLKKVLEIVEAVGPDKFRGDNPLLFRPGYPSSPGQDPIIGLRDSTDQCIEVIKKWYLGESSESTTNTEN